MSWLKFRKKFISLLPKSKILISGKSIFLLLDENGKVDKLELVNKSIYDKYSSRDNCRKFQENILLQKDRVEIMADDLRSDRLVLPIIYQLPKLNEFLKDSSQNYFDSIAFDEPSMTYLILFFENNIFENRNASFIFRRMLDIDTKKMTIENLFRFFLIRFTNVRICLSISRYKKGRKLQLDTILRNCESVLLFITMNYKCPIILGNEAEYKSRLIIPCNESYKMPLIKVKDLFIINKYKQAMSVNQYDLSFLFFYQILERVSQRVAPKLIIDESRKIISVKNKKTDFEKFKDVQNRFKEDGELTVLNKMLQSFVGKDMVKNSLTLSQVNYYENNAPLFINCEGAKLKFDDQKAFANSASSRIYRIRNAIVHSKEENFKRNGKETPFDYTKDIRYLEYELPLIKVITDIAIKALSNKKNGI